MSRFDPWLQTELARLAQRGGARGLRPLTRPAPGVACRDGRRLIDLSSNDYLGLSFHPELRRRAARWALAHGAGAGASRLVGGSLPQHAAIEARLACFKQRDAALLFASGWQANVSVLAALIGRGDHVFADRRVHASLHHGVRAAGAREIRFRHNDAGHLEALLDAHRDRPGQRFIVTESVFSMDGDRADVAAIGALAQRYGAFFFLDDAHATGVLGSGGAGLADASVDAVMGTFSKAMGGFGAYVAGSHALIAYLIQTCSGFIHTTALPPAVLGAIDAALDVVPGMARERAHLAHLAAKFRHGVARLGIAHGVGDTQIVPLIIGETRGAMRLAAGLEDRGFCAVAIRPPTVPEGTSRIRIAFSAAHHDGDVESLIAALGDLVGG